MARQKSYDCTGKVGSGKICANRLHSVIASVRQWQEEHVGSKSQSDAVQNPSGFGSGLARASGETAKAESLFDENTKDHSQCRNRSAGI